MDYVSGTSDAALNSSSASDVSLHQIQRQRKGSSPSAEQLGLKKKFCVIHQPRGPAAQPRAGTLWGCSQGQLTSPAWPGAAEGPAAAALALQDLLEGSRLPTFPSPSLHYFQLQQPPRWLLRPWEVAGGCGSAVALPWTSSLLPSLLLARFLGTLLELRTNCNYFPQ